MTMGIKRALKSFDSKTESPSSPIFRDVVLARGVHVPVVVGKHISNARHVQDHPQPHHQEQRKRTKICAETCTFTWKDTPHFSLRRFKSASHWHQNAEQKLGETEDKCKSNSISQNVPE